MRKALLIFALGLFALGSAGCGTILSPAYWGRHAKNVSREFHELRLDIDHTVFGLENQESEENY